MYSLSIHASLFSVLIFFLLSCQTNFLIFQFNFKMVNNIVDCHRSLLFIDFISNHIESFWANRIDESLEELIELNWSIIVPIHQLDKVFDRIFMDQFLLAENSCELVGIDRLMTIVKELLISFFTIFEEFFLCDVETTNLEVVVVDESFRLTLLVLVNIVLNNFTSFNAQILTKDFLVARLKLISTNLSISWSVHNSENFGQSLLECFVNQSVRNQRVSINFSFVDISIWCIALEVIESVKTFLCYLKDCGLRWLLARDLLNILIFDVTNHLLWNVLNPLILFESFLGSFSICRIQTHKRFDKVSSTF